MRQIIVTEFISLDGVIDSRLRNDETPKKH